MSHILSIARRELRAYFLSPVALIFLGTFLIATLFTFFWVEAFFARNVADVRPLFSWLPVLLIFLVSALSMRQWSEEQKLGTIEILLTLPVPTHRLVIGKFLAGLALIAVALVLTFGLPLTAAKLGTDFDFGPVFAGYFGALLLAGAYLAIGLSISAITDNQIVALIFTTVTCSVLYAIGGDTITGLVGTRGAEILRALGTGSRFESIRRGVFDLRDVLYYASIIVLFLYLNTLALERKRWSDGARTRTKRNNLKLAGALVGINLVLLSIWMAFVPWFRLDATRHGEYSISKVTKDLVRSLDSPLLIRGYFSSKTHPLLAPLVPQIRDLIAEYAVISGGNVKAEFIDPQVDETTERDANQQYGIKSFPFRVASKYEDAVVNSYFSVLVKYGDQYEVLNFTDLIELKPGNQDVEVRLRNLEYDLTRSIKKVAFGFQTLEAVFADMKDDVRFWAYITPGTLPENLKSAPEAVKKALDEVASKSSGKFKFEIVDPVEQKLEKELLEKYGFRPMAASLLSQEIFYFHLLLKVGDQYERIMPSASMSEADIKKEIVASVKRGTPGFLKTIGVVKPKIEPPMQDPRMPHQPPPPEDTTQLVTEKLGENYTVRTLTLEEGRVPGDIDALLLLGPRLVDEKARFAIDQYLMRGGTVLAFTGKYALNPNPGPGSSGIDVEQVASGIDDMLSTWGVTVQETMVLDPQNESFPVPVMRDLGGFKVRDIKLLPYPYFVDVRSTGMAEDEPVVSGLPALTLHWASPVSAVAGTPENKRKVTTLLKSSPASWTQSGTDVQPDFKRYPETGFAVVGETKSHPLAVSVQGKFESAFKDKPSPMFGAPGDAGDRTGQTIKESPESARLVVVGSSSFFNDLVLSLARQSGGERYMNNLQFIENLVDWAVADTDLLTIRSRGTFARTLVPMDAATRRMWEWLNYGFVALALGAIVIVSWTRRRGVVPIDLNTGRVSSSTNLDRPSEARS
ncbi:MAG: Gldg family protein [Deltaproteobacteria bacterium]|nr:Gldg family protein [Deltaproteobacteria bacterium]